MSQPRFSVVVPTRGRPATLPFTLQTCLQQSYPNYEVVVSDNDTSSATREIVDRFQCDRLRYVRVPEPPIAMSDNWNLALAHTTGDYITYLGDDDALMSNAFTHLAALLKAHPTRALTWRPINYSWPSFVVAEEANCLTLPLTREIRKVNSQSRLKDILAFRANIGELPNIYHGLVHRDIIKQSILPNGKVFTGVYPDTVASITFARLARTFLSVTVPYSIAGFSGASNHMAFHLMQNNHPTSTETNRLNTKAGYRLHPWVPDLPVFASVLADSFLRAKENCFPNDDNLVLDRRGITECYLRELPCTDLESRQEFFQRIRSSLADSPELLAWFDSLDLDRYTPPAPRMFRRDTPGFDGQYLSVNLVGFGINDVAAAVKFTSDLLRYPEHEIPFDLPCHAEQVYDLSRKYEELESLAFGKGIKHFAYAMMGRLGRKVKQKMFPWLRSA